jgi:hypothetical protein
MFNIFTLISNNHVLSTDFINPIELDSEFDYGLALIGFHSFNSIANIEEGEIVIYTISGIKAILQDSSVKIADDEGVSPSSSVITRVSCNML